MIIGNLKSNHLSAQGTSNPNPTGPRAACAQYTIAARSWTELTNTGGGTWPSGRYRHAACAIRGAMVIAGGTVMERRQGEGPGAPLPMSVPTDELYVLDLHTVTWYAA